MRFTIEKLPLASLRTFAGKATIRPELAGVLVEPLESGKVRCTATNGYVLLCIEFESAFSDEIRKCVIDNHAIDWALRVLNATRRNEVIFTEEIAAIADEKLCRKPTSEFYYPEYRRLFPSSSELVDSFAFDPMIFTITKEVAWITKGKSACVEYKVFGEEKPVMFFTKNQHYAAFGLLMPQRRDNKTDLIAKAKTIREEIKEEKKQ